jgi:hypothetical protein
MGTANNGYVPGEYPKTELPSHRVLVNEGSPCLLAAP